MTNDHLSIREVMRYAGSQQTGMASLRHALGLDRGSLRLKARNFPFSIMTYNTALMLDTWYKGTDRSAALSELVRRIKVNLPDVVGLCEVFYDDEKEKFRASLSHIYPYYQEGPDEADIEQDGGLLLLTKHIHLTHHHSIYRQCAGSDCMANKGAIHVRVLPPGSPVSWDIFFSHTQNIEEDGGEDALYAQLTHLGHMVRAYADPHTPTIIMGDLNIPAEFAAKYAQLIVRLGTPIDLWPAKHPANSGYTFTTDNNFYDDPGDVPSTNNRLDYILLKAGSRFIPVLKDIEILKWTHAGRQISDHYGLRARFAQLLQVEIDIAGGISQVSAVITGFRCIEETDQPGPDSVSFSITVLDQHGRYAKEKTPVVEDVDTGEYHKFTGMAAAVLNGDPGTHITISVEGTEHDMLDNDSLGIRSIDISREDLLLNKGRSFHRVVPYLTGDGGEYGIEIQVYVN